jgi:hypothetical protein
MQLPFGGGKPPLGVLFDGDIGNRIDTVLALALLYGLDGKNECRTVVVTTSKPNLKSAELCDVLSKFYAAGGFARQLAVGMPETGPGRESTPMLDAVVSKFESGIKHLNDTADVAAVLRNALSAQYDGNSVVVVAGPLTNAATLLKLIGAREWIEKKAKALIFTDHVKQDVESARAVLAGWPGPIVFASPDISSDVVFPAASIEKDFSYTDKHPVVTAYKAYRPMPYDAPTGDMAAVLYAVREKETYFKVSPPGTLSVGDDGSVKFAESASGKHRVLLPDPAQKERILKAYTEIASAKPVPRMRFRPPVVDEKKPEAAKPSAEGVKKP